MLLISCPWCGPRDEVEFFCGGQAYVSRPPVVEDASDEDWSRYLFFRENPRGMHCERWLHRYGCRQWFNVARDTVTHRILSSFRLTDKPPPVESEGPL